jgi:hypothetical protein
MNVHEHDWRQSSIAAILDAVSAALESIDKSFADGDMDVDEAVEQRESFLGIGFVAAQTYIYGAVADATKIAKASGKEKPKDPLKQFSDFIPNTTVPVTKVEVCDAIADYFKHQWPNWIPKPARWESRKPLYDAGISENTNHPCQDAAAILLGPTTTDLRPLLSMLTEWRKKLIAAYK